MSLLKTNQVQLGQSNTATENFTLESPANNTMKLARGNAGATTQDVLTVNASGVVSFPQGLTGNVTGNITGNITGAGTFSGNASSATALATGSTASRTLANRFADVINVKDFGAVGDGVANDTAAIQAAIDYAKQIVINGTGAGGNLDYVKAEVFIPSGLYLLTSVITLANGVSLIGQSSGSTVFIVNHAGNGFRSINGNVYTNVRIENISLRGQTIAQNAFEIYGFLYNCVFQNVVCDDFAGNSWYFDNTWTTKLLNCLSIKAGVHSVYCDIDAGTIFIEGGRYDASGSQSIVMNAPGAGILKVRDAVVQSARGSAVYVTGARTVELNNCLFEACCINTPLEYYVELSGGGNALSNASIIDCILNDAGDPIRTGSGCVLVDGFDALTYRESWVRNAINPAPVIGSSVNSIDISYFNFRDRALSIPSVVYNDDIYAFVRQVGRPTGLFGRDMNDPGTFNPKVAAAANIGLPEIGVAIGTFDQVGSIQSYGAASVLKINPKGGELQLGQNGALLRDTNNEFFGRYANKTQLAATGLTPASGTGYVGIDCSGANRNTTLTNIGHSQGREITIGKTDGTANTLTIIPGSGLINGAANYVLSSPYEHVKLISNGTDYFVI
jgi:hypothetical protein